MYLGNSLTKKGFEYDIQGYEVTMLAKSQTKLKLTADKRKLYLLEITKYNDKRKIQLLTNNDQKKLQLNNPLK